MSSEASWLTPWVAGVLWNKGGQSDPPDTNQQANDPNSWTVNIRPCRSFDPPELEKPVWIPYQLDETTISYLKSPPRPSPPQLRINSQMVPALKFQNPTAVARLVHSNEPGTCQNLLSIVSDSLSFLIRLSDQSILKLRTWWTDSILCEL